MQKTQITNAQKFRLYNFLEQNMDRFNNHNVVEIANAASKALKFHVTTYSIRTTIKDGELPIKLKKNNTNPLAVLHNRVTLLEKAYMKLCREIGATPTDELVSKEENQ